MPVIGEELLLPFTVGEEGERAPPITPGGELFYQRVLPLMQQDEDNGWFGRYLCQAVMGMLQGLDQVAFGDAEHGPWCIVADPKVCPELWLPWNASIYGVELSPGVSAEVERETIEELPPQKRGGIEAMAKAAAPALIGAGTAEDPEFTLELVERPAGKAYAIFGNVFPEPSAAQKEAIEAALLTQKAGGIKLTMSWGAPTWEDATLAWEEATGTWAGATLADVT